MNYIIFQEIIKPNIILNLSYLNFNSNSLLLFSKYTSIKLTRTCLEVLNQFKIFCIPKFDS